MVSDAELAGESVFLGGSAGWDRNGISDTYALCTIDPVGVCVDIDGSGGEIFLWVGVSIWDDSSMYQPSGASQQNSGPEDMA